MAYLDFGFYIYNINIYIAINFSKYLKKSLYLHSKIFLKNTQQQKDCKNYTYLKKKPHPRFYP